MAAAPLRGGERERDEEDERLLLPLLLLLPEEELLRARAGLRATGDVARPWGVERRRVGST